MVRSNVKFAVEPGQLKKEKENRVIQVIETIENQGSTTLKQALMLKESLEKNLETVKADIKAMEKALEYDNRKTETGID